VRRNKKPPAYQAGGFGCLKDYLPLGALVLTEFVSVAGGVVEGDSLLLQPTSATTATKATKPKEMIFFMAARLPHRQRKFNTENIYF
jgi:hypothetical protein